MALARVGGSTYNSGTTAAATHTLSGLSIPIGSFVSIQVGTRSNNVGTVFSATSQPSGSSTFVLRDGVIASAGNARSAIIVAATTTAVITSISVGQVNSAVTVYTVQWFTGLTTDNTQVPASTTLQNATGATQWSGAITPAAAGGLVLGVNALSTTTNNIDADGTTAARSGTANPSWSTTVNVQNTGGGNTSTVAVMGAWGTSVSTASHQAEWVLGANHTGGATGLFVPEGASAAAARFEGINVYNPAQVRASTW